MILISGCSQGHSNENTKQLILPSIVEYSQATQRQLKSELERCRDCKVIRETIIDYGIMRDETREALK
jgi:hypothetical protein